jgi:hypothetical protein
MCVLHNSGGGADECLPQEIQRQWVGRCTALGGEESCCAKGVPALPGAPGMEGDSVSSHIREWWVAEMSL